MAAPLTLDSLREKLKNWKGIEIAKTANPVFGDGNPQATILFVGEAPGQREDEQGKPFVGPAGKLLEELLASIGMERKDVYITNVVKFRPPNNRDPLPEEKEACLPFLQLEIALIKPKVIVPLGRHALTQFFTKMSITDAHGKPHTLRGSACHAEVRDISEANVEPRSTRGTAPAYAHGLRTGRQDDTPSITIFPIYHPAAALHNPGLRDALFADFAALGAFLNEQKSNSSLLETRNSKLETQRSQ